YRRPKGRNRRYREKSGKERDPTCALRAVKKRANIFNGRDLWLVDGAPQQRQGKEHMSRWRGRQRGRSFRHPHGGFPLEPHTSFNANRRVDKVRILSASNFTVPHI